MQLPKLEDYGVSPLTGFLPEDLPLARLPATYAPWEAIANDLPALIRRRAVVPAVDAMPLLPAGKLATIAEQRRAYSILGFIAHAYVWCPPAVNSRIPPQLSIPLLTVASELGLPPLATYAGLCLWNYRVNSTSGPDWTLDDLETLSSYTGDPEEAWFYLVSVAMEKQGGPCLKHGLAVLQRSMQHDVNGCIAELGSLASDITVLTNVMMRMSDRLTPDFFYHTMRPYLAGWKSMDRAGLPNGVMYGDETEARQYSGGSNGQSSLIQALDIILNVEHHALGHRQPPAPLPASGPTGESSQAPQKSNAFLLEMRKYMPREHREFLQALEECAALRPFVMANKDRCPELVQAYDHCLQTLREFRSKHIQIVMRYISLPARKSNQGVGLASSDGGQTGTGGTELMPFLKQTRDEVSDAAAGDWKRSLLTTVDRPASPGGQYDV